MTNMQKIKSIYTVFLVSLMVGISYLIGQEHKEAHLELTAKCDKVGGEVLQPYGGGLGCYKELKV